MNNRVIILSGVAGSGKTTYAKSISDYAVIVSADHFFERSGPYKFDASKLSEAHGACFRSFVEHIRANDGTTIIVDNTNTTAQEIAPYVLAAQAYGASAEIVTMAAPTTASERDEYVRKCVARNQHGAGFATITGQAWRLLKRRLPPWWNSRTVPPI